MQARDTLNASEPGSRGHPRGRLLTGTQGFSYDEWDGLVYPPGLPKTQRLAWVARTFDMVELDSTFYGPPRPASVQRWADQTPESFVIAAKVPRQITHEARLAGAGTLQALAVFLDVMRLLGPRLGPVVLQLGPHFRFPRDLPALEATCLALPGMGSAGLRLTVEFRHPSWLQDDALEHLLREHGLGWVWNDWYPTEPHLEQMPRAIDGPAAQRIAADDFAYLRLTGNHAACVDNRTLTIDRTDDLLQWAGLVQGFRAGSTDRDVYILLNNHYAGSGPLAIRELQDVLDMPRLALAGDSPAAAMAEPDKAGRLRLPGF